MATKPFVYQDPYPLGEDKTKYRKIGGSEKYVSITSFEGNEILKVDPEALTILANEAMRDVAFLLRPEHNESVGRILRDPEASQNDRSVAVTLLRNAAISAGAGIHLYIGADIRRPRNVVGLHALHLVAEVIVRDI